MADEMVKRFALGSVEETPTGIRVHSGVGAVEVSDEILREVGYLKMPECVDCGGFGLNSAMDDGLCPSCEGYGRKP